MCSFVFYGVREWGKGLDSRRPPPPIPMLAKYCSFYIQFWYTNRYGNNDVLFQTLAFGTGWEPSEETRILYTMDNLLPPFALVSFASGTTDSAIWEIQLANSTSDTDNGIYKNSVSSTSA